MENHEKKIRALIAGGAFPQGSLEGGVADQGVFFKFEQSHHVCLPVAYKNWLTLANGALVGEEGLFGIGTRNPFLDIEEVLKVYPVWERKKWIPVAGDGCGNYYLLEAVAENSPVFFIDTAENPTEFTYVVASDLWHFIWFYLQEALGEERWPADPEYVLAEDPRIQTCSNIPPIWKT